MVVTRVTRTHDPEVVRQTPYPLGHCSIHSKYTYKTKIKYTDEWKNIRSREIMCLKPNFINSIFKTTKCKIKLLVRLIRETGAT